MKKTYPKAADGPLRYVNVKLTPQAESRYRRESLALARLSTDELLARAKPLTAAQRKEWENLKRGRPLKPADKKARRVLLTVEPALLKKADAYAKAHGLSRSGLFAAGIRKVLAG